MRSIGASGIGRDCLKPKAGTAFEGLNDSLRRRDGWILTDERDGNADGREDSAHDQRSEPEGRQLVIGFALARIRGIEHEFSRPAFIG